MDHLPIFAGMSALKDNKAIADLLAEHGALVGRGEVTHSYPHSWRSHAPLIFRNTPQWFISMESHGLREILHFKHWKRQLSIRRKVRAV